MPESHRSTPRCNVGVVGERTAHRCVLQTKFRFGSDAVLQTWGRFKIEERFSLPSRPPFTAQQATMCAATPS